MAHIEDRWMKTGPTGRKVKTERHGAGLRWLAVWNERDGRRRKRGFSTKDAAQAHLDEVAHAVRSGRMRLGAPSAPRIDWFSSLSTSDKTVPPPWSAGPRPTTTQRSWMRPQQGTTSVASPSTRTGAGKASPAS